MKLCTVEGCEKRHFGLGYCGMHYQRVQKFGSTDDPKPDDFGTKKKHPLFRKWCQIKRLENGRAIEWEDFWQFVKDVEPKPENNMLEAIDYSKPIGPGNFKWSEMGFGLIKPRTKPDNCLVEGCTNSVRSSGLCKKHYWRKVKYDDYEASPPKGINKEKFDLKKRKLHLRKYNLTIEQYNELYAQQEGKCKICSDWHEILYVDHNHITNVVRGLLCNSCNLAIGLLKDSAEFCVIAARYLIEYAKVE